MTIHNLFVKQIIRSKPNPPPLGFTGRIASEFIPPKLPDCCTSDSFTPALP